MIRSGFVSVVICLIIVSCKKESSQIIPSEQKATANYSQLSVGNYWVYERFKVDSLGNSTSQNIFDSCYISKDTVINGLQYFAMYRSVSYSNNHYTYLRDSGSYIVNHLGRIIFSHSDFTTIFYDGYATASTYDTIAHGIAKMVNKDSLITVPAGTFTTSNYRLAHYMYPNWQAYYKVRYNNTCYADNVGIVLETLYILYTDPYHYERRLIRYHVN